MNSSTALSSRFVFPVPTRPEGEAKRVVGTWRLIKSEVPPEIRQFRGEQPTGFIHYDANGYMSVQIVPDRDRGMFPTYSPTAEQALNAILGYAAYFGTYSVDLNEMTITHHRACSLTTLKAVDIVRRFELRGDNQIVLKPKESSNILVWERLT